MRILIICLSRSILSILIGSGSPEFQERFSTLSADALPQGSTAFLSLWTFEFQQKVVSTVTEWLPGCKSNHQMAAIEGKVNYKISGSEVTYDLVITLQCFRNKLCLVGCLFKLRYCFKLFSLIYKACLQSLCVGLCVVLAGAVVVVLKTGPAC